MNTYHEAAKKLGVSIHTFRRMVKRRIIAVDSIGPQKYGVRQEEIDRIAAKHTRVV